MLDSTPQAPQPPMAPMPPIEPVEPSHPHRPAKKWLAVTAVIVMLLIGGVLCYVLMQTKPSSKANSTAASQTQTTSAQTPAPAVQGTQLDLKKSYGNKYANGLVPVGDNHYVTSGAKQGYIYTCSANFVPAGQAGAQSRGPWFMNNNTQYDLNKKSHIGGSVSWTPSMTNTVSGATRTISTNDLPAHKTGVFPVSGSDPAYAYDRNPNSIKSQALTYALNANPTYGSPNCVGGEVGVMLTGVALFDGFDAGGRDAGAWEIQDGCDGHPQDKGEYHYHSLSRCVADIGVGTVIGFALDGFPITGPLVGSNNILTTSDLDECHGLTSEITLDGKKATTYHYVMTQDFPYSLSCFRSKPIQAPGLKEGGGAQPPAPPSGQKPPGTGPPSRY